MSTRILVATLLVTTAFTGLASAQTAQAPADVPKPALAPASVTPVPAVQAPAVKPPVAQAPVVATPVQAAAPKPVAAAPAPAAPKPVAAQAPKPVDVGAVYAKEPEQPKSNPVLAQPGLTASPTDYAIATEKRSAPAAGGAPGAATAATGPTRTSVGGVTGQDLGGGYIIREEAKKARSTITRDAIDKQSPTANPFQAINLLPGVVQSSTDNSGAQGGNIRLRGFNSDKIGLTIEGMPVNDSGNYALFPQEYLDAQNVGQISIAQGTPELDSPHIGSTGGVINIYLREPSKELGALVDYTFGSHNLNRVFARVDTGQIGSVRSFLSVSKLQQDHWGDNPGTDDRLHFDFKTVYDISPGNTIRFAALYNDATNNFYPNPTLTQFNTNSIPLFRSQLPGSFFSTTAPVNQSSNGAGNFVDYRVNPFKNLILSAPSNFTVSEKLKFDTIPYYWYGFGSGGGTSAVRERAAGAVGNPALYWGNLRITGVNFGATAGLGDTVLLYNPSITETHRPGVINKFSYTEGNHKFVFGNWFEYANHRQTGPYIPLAADGGIQDVFAENGHFQLPAGARCQVWNPATQTAGATVACPGGPVQRRDQKTTTYSNAVFFGDTWKFAPGWSLDAGVKQVWVNRTVNNRLPGANPADGEINDTATLPTAGLGYKFDDANQVFTGYGASFRSAPNFTAIQSVRTDNGNVTPPSPIPAEEGHTFELGYRHNGKMVAASLTGFYGMYENFQQSTSILDPTGGTGNFTTTINIGGLVNYGVQAEVGTAPIMNFRPYVSAEYLQTELQDNKLLASTTAGRNDFLRTKGNSLPGASEYNFGLGLDYDDGKFFAGAEYKYVGPQFATFANDEELEAFGRLNMNVGYRFADFEALKKPEIKLNLFNVLNDRQLVGVNSITNNAKTATTVNGLTVNPSAPNYFLGQDFSFMVTLRAGLGGEK